MHKKLLIGILILVSFLSITPILSQTVFAQVPNQCDKSASFLSLPTWYKYLEVSPDATGKCEVTGPKNAEGQFDWKAGLSRIALAVVDILLRIAALVSVGFIIYGGFRYILSQGDPNNTVKARNTILNAVIGLIITMFSTAMVNLIGSTLWK